MEQGIYGRNIEDYLAASGLKKRDMVSRQFEGHRTGVMSWKLEGREIDTTGIGREFPGLTVSSSGSRSYPGVPMTWEYEICGPVDQVDAFVRKYGNDNLREAMGLQ